MTSPNPYIEVNLVIDYDLLESRRCLCGLAKDMGYRMCGTCYKRLSVSQRVTLVKLRPGDGLASVVAGFTGSK